MPSAPSTSWAAKPMRAKMRSAEGSAKTVSRIIVLLLSGIAAFA